MKKHNLSKFFKSKSFYVLLSVGALAMLVITVVGFYQSSNINRNNQVDEDPKPQLVEDDNAKDNNKLDNDNKPPSSLAKNDNSKDRVEGFPKKTDTSNEITKPIKPSEPVEPTTDDKLLEYDDYQGPDLDALDYLEEAIVKNKEPVEVEEVMKPTVLHFDHEADKLLWPVSGNVIRKYSIDSLVHHETLQQWKVSPAMLISAEEGEEVICSVDGIITSIEEDEETGITVTTSIGDGYNLIYGQLEKEDLALEEGDSIEKGQIIGSISKPTRYNVVEGPSMYLQLVKGDETLNPMLCLE